MSVYERPSYLTNDQKETTFATQYGWEYRDPKTRKPKGELLVALKHLVYNLNTPSIYDIYFIYEYDNIGLVIVFDSEVQISDDTKIDLHTGGIKVGHLKFIGFLDAHFSTRAVFILEVTKRKSAKKIHSSRWELGEALEGIITDIITKKSTDKIVLKKRPILTETLSF